MGIYYCDECGHLILNSVIMESYPHARNCKNNYETEQLAQKKKEENNMLCSCISDSIGNTIDTYGCALHDKTSPMAKKLETERQENLALLVSCAKDVLDYWPQMTFRTIRIMMGKMENLRQAYELCKPNK